jgi:uncharacterized membrane protein/nitrite reductase/ring-hydroxylating ferredoxin subunit
MRTAAILDLVRQLEGDERLETVVSPVHAAVSKVAARWGGRELLSGSALGHPVHPLLVSMPIGCFTSAMAADLVGQRDAARMLTGLGVLAAVPTAATGLSDWVDTADAERRVGFVHLAANIVAVSLYTASWIARRRGERLRGQALGVAGAAVMSLAGWLGGHLAYGMGVGIDTTAFAGGPTEWTLIARPGDSPERHATAAGVALAVLEDEDGRPRVLADRCTHRGGPLSQGEVSGGCVTCPWHGSRFDTLSTVTSPEAPRPTRSPSRSFA